MMGDVSISKLSDLARSQGSFLGREPEPRAVVAVGLRCVALRVASESVAQPSPIS